MNTAVILLGANLGNPELTFSKGLDIIEQKVGKITDLSALYETAAWGVTEQPDFLNQVVIIRTKLKARALLEQLQEIEIILGRTHREKWHARHIDIDILFFNEAIIDEPGLQVPHPAIASRKFTLVPLDELLPEMMHPVYKKSINQLLALCNDKLPVKKIEKASRNSA